MRILGEHEKPFDAGRRAFGLPFKVFVMLEAIGGRYPDQLPEIRFH